jgi:hypothetical protein
MVSETHRRFALILSQIPHNQVKDVVTITSMPFLCYRLLILFQIISNKLFSHLITHTEPFMGRPYLRVIEEN